jgi:thiol-disulfide isomerase/thioredoxin
MKKVNLILLVLLFQLNGYTQGESSASHEPVNLIGIKTKEDFKKPPFDEWFISNYNDYLLDDILVKKISKHLKGVTIKAFMGTWCDDSKLETPRFYKLLDSLNFDQKKLTMITVNRAKETPDNLQEGLNILWVPTFIFYRNGKEIGRYVEYPQETLENDILKILSGQPYKHSYEDQ